MNDLIAKTLDNFRTTKLLNFMDVPWWHTLVSLLEVMVDSNYLLNTVFDWPHEQLGSCDFSLITWLHQHHLEISLNLIHELYDFWLGWYLSRVHINIISIFFFQLIVTVPVVLNVSRLWKPRHNRFLKLKQVNIDSRLIEEQLNLYKLAFLELLHVQMLFNFNML